MRLYSCWFNHISKMVFIVLYFLVKQLRNKLNKSVLVQLKLKYYSRHWIM